MPVIDEVPNWIWENWDPKVLDEFPLLDRDLLRIALLRMARGKTCAEDKIVAEMLFCLSDEALDVIALSFRLRLLNTPDESSDQTWSHHVVSLIMKKANATAATDFRPIAILPVLYKWYSRVLMLLVPEQIQDISRFQFAFRKHHQATEVIFILRRLIEHMRLSGNS